MPSSYTLSLRLTLQATGENNNTWGVILNQGVFGLVDYAIAGRLAFDLSGVKVLTSALGATDEARAAFLDITGGSGGSVAISAASKGYFVRNSAAGQVVISAGGISSAIFLPGDAGPCFSDGATVYGLQLGGKPLGQYVRDADQAVIDYVNAAISAGNQLLPPAEGHENMALMVRPVGAPPVDAWIPDTIKQSDVVGLPAALAQTASLNPILARAFYGDMF